MFKTYDQLDAPEIAGRLIYSGDYKRQEIVKKYDRVYRNGTLIKGGVIDNNIQTIGRIMAGH